MHIGNWADGPKTTGNSFVNWSAMVLGTLLSLNYQLLNVTAQNTSMITLEHNFPDTNLSNYDGELDVRNKEFVPVFELVLGTMTYLVIILMTFVGNSMVVIAVFSYRPLKKVQNYFLVSLAASDLAVALIVMPLHVVKFLANGRWLLGVTVCQLFTTADILLCTSSILNLCAIAIDRYLAIHNPITYAQRRTPRFVCMIIILVWILSGIISIPPLAGWNDWSSQKLQDHCELTTEKAFVVFSAAGSFFVPLLVMIVVYMKIFVSARRRIRTNRGRSALVRIQNQQKNDKKTLGAKRPTKSSISLNDSRKLIAERAPLVEVCSGMTNGEMSSDTKNSDELSKPPKVSMQTRNSHPTVDPSALKSMLVDVSGNGTTTTNLNSMPTGEQLTTTVLRKREKISVAKEKRAAKTIAVIIFVFAFCWLPFFCAYVILPFCETCYLHPKVHQAFVWLGYINSSLNPFLYGILNLEFRRAFRKILCPKQFMGRRRSTVIRH